MPGNSSLGLQELPGLLQPLWWVSITGELRTPVQQASSVRAGEQGEDTVPEALTWGEPHPGLRLACGWEVCAWTPEWLPLVAILSARTGHHLPPYSCALG